MDSLSSQPTQGKIKSSRAASCLMPSVPGTFLRQRRLAPGPLSTSTDSRLSTFSVKLILSHSPERFSSQPRLSLWAPHPRNFSRIAFPCGSLALCSMEENRKQGSEPFVLQPSDQPGTPSARHCCSLPGSPLDSGLMLPCLGPAVP